MIKLVFFGNSQYSQIVLKALQADKRFQIVADPKEADVGVLASYGRILTKEELALPKHGILNIHPSMLPKYRGPTPVPTAILKGEKITGVSIIKMDEEVDHGPIIIQFEIKIYPEDTAESLLKRAFTEGAIVLLKILPDYLQKKITPQPQNHRQATFTNKLTREEGKIDWSKSPEYLERMVRAYFPWPGSWTEVEIRDTKNVIRKTKIENTSRVSHITYRPKRLKILKAHLDPSTGSGQERLVLDLVQLEGKKPVSYKQFLEGHPGVKINP